MLSVWSNKLGHAERKQTGRTKDGKGSWTMTWKGVMYVDDANALKISWKSKQKYMSWIRNRCVHMVDGECTAGQSCGAWHV